MVGGGQSSHCAELRVVKKFATASQITQQAKAKSGKGGLTDATHNTQHTHE